MYNHIFLKYTKKYSDVDIISNPLIVRYKKNTQLFAAYFYNIANQAIGNNVNVNYRPADLFLYSLIQASRRSWAVVSPGTLCEGWM